MCRNCSDPRYKLCYSPLEAAIRWCDLFAFEAEILQVSWYYPEQLLVLFPQWPCLSTHLAMILDAIDHRELPSSRSDCIVSGAPDDDPTRLQIRHYDLKAWMLHFHPDQKPAFLSICEPVLEGHIKLGAYLALKAENDNLVAECRNMSATIKDLQKTRDDPEVYDDQARKLFALIAMLLDAMLNTPSAEKNRPSFASQDAISSALAEQNAHHSGLGKRTINKYFSIANRQLKKV